MTFVVDFVPVDEDIKQPYRNEKIFGQSFDERWDAIRCLSYLAMDSRGTSTGTYRVWNQEENKVVKEWESRYKR